MNSKYKIAIQFGALHGINDFIAGFLLSSLSLTNVDVKTNTIAFLMYSVIAFGGQLPAGIVVDKSKNIKLYTIIAIVCMLLAITISYESVFYAILLSAVASAFIHVCGGAACYLSDQKSSTLAGLFTSPGVLGLITGGILASTSFQYFYVLIPILLLLLLMIIKTKLPIYNAMEKQTENAILETHDFFMLILLLAIAFRSLLWNVMHMMCFNDTTWLLSIGVAASSGKLVGGYLSDKVNWKRFVFISMFLSVLLLNLGKENIWLFALGVALLQSAVPITLLLMQQYMRNSPAVATGLSLGLAIVLAGMPTYIQQFREIQGHKIFILLLSIVFLISNFLIIRKKEVSA